PGCGSPKRSKSRASTSASTESAPTTDRKFGGTGQSRRPAPLHDVPPANEPARAGATRSGPFFRAGADFAVASGVAFAQQLRGKKPRLESLASLRDLFLERKSD